MNINEVEDSDISPFKKEQNSSCMKKENNKWI